MLESREKAICKAIRLNQVIVFLSLLSMLGCIFFYKIIIGLFMFGPSPSLFRIYLPEVLTLLFTWLGIFICSIVVFFLTVSLYEELAEYEAPGRICLLLSGICLPILMFILPFLTVITLLLSIFSWVQLKKART